MQVTDRTAPRCRRASLDASGQLDQVEILVAQGLLATAFAMVNDLLQPGKRASNESSFFDLSLILVNRKIPEHRCQLLISNLSEHISSENDAYALLMLCQHFSHSERKFSLLGLHLIGLC